MEKNIFKNHKGYGIKIYVNGKQIWKSGFKTKKEAERYRAKILSGFAFA